MSEQIISSYDITLANMLRAYRQKVSGVRIAVVVDDVSYGWCPGLDDSWDDWLKDEVKIYRHVHVYDPELHEEITFNTYDSYSQIGDVIAYEIRNGKHIIVKNFTREPKDQIIKNFDRAYNLVFGPGYNNKVKGGK